MFIYYGVLCDYIMPSMNKIIFTTGTLLDNGKLPTYKSITDHIDEGKDGQKTYNVVRRMIMDHPKIFTRVLADPGNKDGKYVIGFTESGRAIYERLQYTYDSVTDIRNDTLHDMLKRAGL